MKAEIVNVSVKELIPYARNARTHSQVQVAQIASSIKEFGWTNPILIDGARGIIAGHGRLLAAQLLKIDKVPVIELAHLTEAQKRAYIIADNKLALNAGWDNEMLSVEITDLQEGHFDMSLTGFDKKELSELNGIKRPEGGPNALDSVYEVVVECKNESEQQEVYEYLIEKDYPCRILTI